MRFMMNGFQLVTLSVFLAASAVVFAILHTTRPEPYMDEIFHVPQAMKYCQGRFTEVREQVIRF